MIIIDWLILEVRRRYLKKFLSQSTQHKKRNKKEVLRIKDNKPHEVFYLHQVDDPYSHLCCQVLDQLIASYEIKIIPLVVGMPPQSTTPEIELLKQHSIDDATIIAPYYGLDFSTKRNEIPIEMVDKAQSILLSTNSGQFASKAKRVGEALWQNNSIALDEMMRNIKPITNEELKERIEINNKKRKQLGHYLGAVFAYEGECYWSIDRLPFLEERLKHLNVRKNNKELVIKRNSLKKNKPLISSQKMTIDFFISARSPYSYLALKQLIELKKQLPLKINYRPILPMVMRGMKIDLEKGMYILSDCKRIANQKEISFGNITDPLGRAVERFYSLFPYVKELNKEEEFFDLFLTAVWANGKHGYLDSTLKNIIRKLDLPWDDAKKELDTDYWREEIENNRKAMYKIGKWGPPSFAVKNQNNEVLINLWGQDRLWLIEEMMYLMKDKDK
jgi:2-hydroxychromene-2-carboxylate isomerase